MNTRRRQQKLRAGTPARRPGTEARGNAGAVLTHAKAALLLTDVINDLDFPGSEPLTRAAEAMAPRLARLADRARQAGVPVVYVNDNFGHWQSDWRKVVAWCERPQSPGRKVVEQLRPRDDDYFVLKPKHSGFFSTTLDLLLKQMGVRTVVLAGIATDICILFTANDAYMRDYSVAVVRDCVAANTARKTAFTLGQIRDVLKGATPAAQGLTLATLRGLRETGRLS